ncbi:MAG: hypothetical protein JXB35_13620 [Anaerolineae bacterium]|nr:hypothetical protein [Anaerolineae bacterium]
MDKRLRRLLLVGASFLFFGGVLLVVGGWLVSTAPAPATSAAKPTPSAPRVDEMPPLGSEADAGLGGVALETPVPTPAPPAPEPVNVFSFTPDEMEIVLRERGIPLERHSPLKGRVLVGLYGTPLGPGLGILGTASPTTTVALARQQALEYQALLSDTEVIPFFHMVTTIADAYPGDDGDYNHRVSPDTVQKWIDVARANGLWSVVDIQPGHGVMEVELAFVEFYIRQPSVHLAIDPEFVMLPGAIPGERIGTLDGATVNVVQAWLGQIAREVGERKILIIHQFDDRMFLGKELLNHDPFVDVIWDSDGFGGPPAKIADYEQYAREPGFEYGGFKLFYDYDVPLMSPAQVLQLEPFPVFVVYQ